MIKLNLRIRHNEKLSTERNRMVITSYRNEAASVATLACWGPLFRRLLERKHC